jgi:hypothetical protein
MSKELAFLLCEEIESRAFVHFFIGWMETPAPTELMEQAKVNYSPIATGRSELNAIRAPLAVQRCHHQHDTARSKTVPRRLLF